MSRCDNQKANHFLEFINSPRSIDEIAQYINEYKVIGHYHNDLMAHDPVREDWRRKNSITERNIFYYSGCGFYHTLESMKWYYDKTGFPIHPNHVSFFSLIPAYNACAAVKTNKPMFDELSKPEQYNAISIHHRDGQMQQIRPAKPIHYISGDKEVFIKYITVTEHGEGADKKVFPIHVPRIANLRPEDAGTLVITEGLTKAFAISHCGFDALHLAGVTMWQKVLPQIKELIVTKRFTRIVLAFDSDHATNPKVAKQLNKLSAELGATIADWNDLFDSGDAPKGFDDLAIRLKGDKEKLRSILLHSKVESTDEEITDFTDKYRHAIRYIEARHPSYYCADGQHFLDGEQVSYNHIQKLVYELIERLYYTTQRGKTYPFRDKKVSDFFTRMDVHFHTEKRRDGGFEFLNGVFTKGAFQEGSTSKLAYNYTYNPDLADPTELIEWLKVTHGGLDYRYWLRGLFDNSVGYSAILGVAGKSGSGKSLTLSIPMLLLSADDYKDIPLNRLETAEHLGQVGRPRMICASDCKKYPENPENLYKISSATPLAVRHLYSRSMEQVTFYTRLAFAYVNLPYIPDSDDGFLRRFKEITCTAGADPLLTDSLFGQDGLLLDQDYKERVVNWILKADIEGTREFYDSRPREVNRGERVRKLPEFAYLDRICTMDKRSSRIGVELELVYEGYRTAMESQRRRWCSYDTFKKNVISYGFQVELGGVTVIDREVGSFDIREDRLMEPVDTACYNLINLGMPIGRINNRYFDQQTAVKNSLAE